MLLIIITRAIEQFRASKKYFSFRCQTNFVVNLTENVENVIRERFFTFDIYIYIYIYFAILCVQKSKSVLKLILVKLTDTKYQEL